MVNNIHLNRRGFKGDGLACFFRSLQCLQIKQVFERRHSVLNLNPLIINQIDNFGGTSPPISPSKITKPLLSYRLMKVAYGSGNRMAENEGACLLFRQAYPHPPAPSANIVVSHKNIFQNFGERHA